MKKNLITFGWVTVLVLLCVWWRASVIGPAWTVGLDDANIYYTYAKNIASGHGPVFAVGGEHVEGFSSPLWLALLTAGYAITNGNVEIAALFLSIIFTVLTLFIALRALEQHYQFSVLSSQFSVQRSPFSVLRFPFSVLHFAFCIVVLTTGGFVDWFALSGMDTCLWGLLLTASVALIADQNSKQIWRTVVFCLLVIARPEGMIVAPILAFFDAFIRRNTLVSSLPVLITLLTVLSLLAARYSLFGYLLPNTYYAKVSPSILTNVADGIQYGAKWIGLTSVSTFLALCVALFLLFKHRDLRRQSLVVSSLFCICLVIGIIIFEGGDHFEVSRFFQPVTPLVWIAFVLSTQGAEHRTQNVKWRMDNGKWIMVFLGVVLVNQLMPLSMAKSIVVGRPMFFHTTTSKIAPEFTLAAEGRFQGRLLNSLFSTASASANTASLPKVGAFTVGGIAYSYKGTVIDLLGLNSVRIAHAPVEQDIGKRNHRAFKRAEFYSDPPDVLYCFVARNDDSARVYIADSIFAHQEFQTITHGITNEKRFKDMFEIYRADAFNKTHAIYLYARKRWMDASGLNLPVVTAP